MRERVHLTTDLLSDESIELVAELFVVVAVVVVELNIFSFTCSITLATVSISVATSLQLVLCVWMDSGENDVGK